MSENAQLLFQRHKPDLTQLCASATQKTGVLTSQPIIWCCFKASGGGKSRFSVKQRSFNETVFLFPLLAVRVSDCNCFICMNKGHCQCKTINSLVTLNTKWSKRVRSFNWHWSTDVPSIILEFISTPYFCWVKLLFLLVHHPCFACQKRWGTISLWLCFLESPKIIFNFCILLIEGQHFLLPFGYFHHGCCHQHCCHRWQQSEDQRCCDIKHCPLPRRTQWIPPVLITLNNMVVNKNVFH